MIGDDDSGGWDGSDYSAPVTVNTGIQSSTPVYDPSVTSAPSYLTNTQLGSNGVAGVLGTTGGNGATGLQSLLALGGGLYGLSQANSLSSMAAAAFNASNPFAAYRAQYANELSSLMANPSQIYNDPGYQASLNQGEQAVTRQMAAQGYKGSGNEAVALQQYGDSFASTYLAQQESLLSNLAGANISPNYGAALSAQGQSSQIASSALNSAIYGASGLYNSYNGAAAGTPASGSTGPQ